jgi:hypothetical protein
MFVCVAMVAGPAVEGGRAPSRAGPKAAADWRVSLREAHGALRAGDVQGAERAWEEAYRVASMTSEPESMLSIGRAYLAIGSAAHGHATASDRARRIFQSAFYQARGLRSPQAMADASEALAGIGEVELAVRGFSVAVAVARQGRDVQVLERVAAQRDGALVNWKDQTLAAPSLSEAVWTP